MATESPRQSKTNPKKKTRKRSAPTRSSAEKNVSAENAPPQKSSSEESQPSQPADLVKDADEELALLRDLILGSYQKHMTGLQNELDSTQQEMDAVLGKIDDLSERIDDKEALLQTISPVIANSIRSSIRDSRPEMIEAISPIMADTIRTNIRDSKDQMVEALYPIMGQLVQRAVREAMKDLVRRIDRQIQSRISLFGIFGQMRARFSGVSPGELALRASLPFDATDLFLIHRHTGLLLLYISDDIVEVSPDWATDRDLGHDIDVAEQPETGSQVLEGEIVSDHALYDTDLISGMLTAIRDFVQDAFGRGENENLDQVVYGEKQILIETAHNTYLAIVVEGTEPYDFRSGMRDCLIEIEHEFSNLLPDYDGNAAPFESKKEQLQSLLKSTERQNFDATPKLLASNGVQSDRAENMTTAFAEDNLAIKNAIGQSSSSAGSFGEKPNSTLPTPLSILLIINLIILLLWWFLR